MGAQGSGRGWHPVAAEVTGWSLDSHAGCVNWERRALSCGVVGFWRGGEWWGDQLEGREGRASEEGWKMGLGVARRGTSEDQHGRGRILGQLVGGQSECLFLGCTKDRKAALVRGVSRWGQIVIQGGNSQGWLVGRGLVQSMKEPRGWKMSPGIRDRAEGGGWQC